MEGLECQRKEFGLFSIIKGETLIFLDQESRLIKGMAVKNDLKGGNTEIREICLESVARV